MPKFRQLITIGSALMSGLLISSQSIAAPLRYTATASVQGVYWNGTPLANCQANACQLTMTGVGDSVNSVPFPLVCVSGPGCYLKGTGGGGVWNLGLTNVSLTLYDPYSGTTYGPVNLPNDYFVSYDNFNGGIGFGSHGAGGPAYPLSLVFPGQMYAYSYTGLSINYGLDTPILAGGEFENCPAGGGCASVPPTDVIGALADGTAAAIAVPDHYLMGNFWTQQEPPAAQWNAAAAMSQARTGHTASVLAGGQVVVVGGNADGLPAHNAELFDPAANVWTAAGTPSCSHAQHTATALADGRLLVVGGTTCPQTAEVFDPSTGAWTVIAAPAAAFPGPSAAVLLNDHRVLVAGSGGAHIYDPAVNTWTVTTGFAAATLPTAAVLSTGTVALLDAQGCTTWAGIITLQLFDPASGSWTAGPQIPGPAMPNGCSTTRLSALALPGGKLLATGSRPPYNALINPSPYGWAATYDVASGTWPNLDYASLPLGGDAIGTVLANGKPLLVGGNSLVPQQSPAFAPATLPMPAQISALFDPASGTWSPYPALATARSGHTLVTLQNGDVLAIGGQALAPGQAALNSVERLVAVVPVAQTITFSTPATLSLGTTLTLSASATSGLPVVLALVTPSACTLSGNVLTPVSTGTCSVTASQSGNTYVLPATTVTNTITVTAASQTIVFAMPATSLPAGGTLTLSATASSGLPVSFSSATPTVCSVSGAVLTGLIGGTCTISANQAGDANYLPASPVTARIAITKLAQAISPPLLPTTMLRRSRLTLSASASSGLPVTFASTTPRYCTVTNNRLTAGLLVGNCAITAKQAGNTKYLAAPTLKFNIGIR